MPNEMINQLLDYLKELLDQLLAIVDKFRGVFGGAETTADATDAEPTTV